MIVAEDNEAVGGGALHSVDAGHPVRPRVPSS